MSLTQVLLVGLWYVIVPFPGYSYLLFNQIHRVVLKLLRGGSRIFGKGVHMYKGVWGVAFLILFHFSYISHENEMIWSDR